MSCRARRRRRIVGESGGGAVANAARFYESPAKSKALHARHAHKDQEEKTICYWLNCEKDTSPPPPYKPAPDLFQHHPYPSFSLLALLHATQRACE